MHKRECYRVRVQMSKYPSTSEEVLVTATSISPAERKAIQAVTADLLKDYSPRELKGLYAASVTFAGYVIL